MTEYHKINTIYKRDPSGKRVLWDQFSCPEFEYLQGNEWVFTEKVDGTNIRVMWDGERIVFGGKTDRAQIPAPLFQRLQELFPPGRLDGWDTPACLYGEGYGAGIQKGGGLYSPTPEFVLFDIKIGDWWLLRNQVAEIGGGLGLRVVPVVGSGTLTDMVKLARSAFPSQWGDFPAEGIVARPVVELSDRAGHRVITKIKLRDFD